MLDLFTTLNRFQSFLILVSKINLSLFSLSFSKKTILCQAIMIKLNEYDATCCLMCMYYFTRVKFSDFYLLIGWKIKSYLANSEKNFGLLAFMKATRPKKAKKKILPNESE